MTRPSLRHICTLDRGIYVVSYDLKGRKQSRNIFDILDCITKPQIELMQSKKDSPVGDNKFTEKPSFYSIQEHFDIKDPPENSGCQ